MARPVQVSDDDILCSAREVFATQGPAATISCIAARVGLSQAALFKRFGTKENLLHRAFELPEPAWVQRVKEGPDARQADAQLREIGLEILTFARFIVPRVSVLKSAGLRFEQIFKEHPEPPPVRAQRVLAGWFERAMARGLIRPSDPNVLAFAFFGPFQSRAFWLHMTGEATLPISDEAFVASIVDVFYRGIAPEDPRAA